MDGGIGNLGLEAGGGGGIGSSSRGEDSSLLGTSLAGGGGGGSGVGWFVGSFLKGAFGVGHIDKLDK